LVALFIIIGIIVFFALILSIRAHIHFEYEDGKELTAWAKWAFIKIPLLPQPEKPPKEKKEKPKAQEPAATQETTPTEPKTKGPNPLKNIYENEQLQGIMDIFGKLLQLIDKFGRGVINSFVIDEMFLDVDITKGDAATTAEEYGKLCRVIFPVFGAVCANCNVKQYSLNVEPDYIAKPGVRIAFSMEISLNPRKLINAVLAFAFGAVFKIGIRLIKDLKPKNPPAETQAENKADTQSATDNNVNNTESGVV
jgi:hypothetical protein